MSKEITLQIEVPNDNLLGAIAVIQAAVNAAPADIADPKVGPLETVRVNGMPLNPLTFNQAHS